MLLFLQIVAGVLVALLLAVVVGWWGIKSWLRRKMGDYSASAALLDDRYDQPVRLQLQLAEAEEVSESFAARWTEAYALGFRQLADLCGREGVPSLLRAAAHESLPYALALCQHEEDVHATLFALDEGQHLVALGDGPGQSLREGNLCWQVERDLDLGSALRQLQSDCLGRSLKSVDLRLFRSVWERAHARRQDALLATPPRREELEQYASARPSPPTAAQLEQAWQMRREQWLGRLSESALDHYRKTSRIDAEAWERISDDLHVVHGHLSDEEVRDLLVQQPAESELAEQLQAQGLHGLALYESLAERLPAVRQRKLLMEVRRPVLARIYGRVDEPSGAPAALPHFYRARDATGREVDGAVLARDSGEAKAQLRAQGLDAPRISLEPTPLDAKVDFVLEPELAAIVSRSAHEGLGMALLRAIRGNLWLWFPPALWVAWSAYQGPAYGWGDYLGFVYLALALVALLLFVAPMVLYNQLQLCRVHGRWRSARLCLALLQRLNFLGVPDGNQMELEWAKIKAAGGDPPAALQHWNRHADARSEAQQLAGLVQIHDAAGQAEQTIAAQRRLLALQPGDLPRIDLALSLARRAECADEAELLLAGVSPQNLSELALAGYQFARGIIADHRGQSAQALHHFAQAVEQASQFKSTPLVLAMLAEINGHAALALKRSGEVARADALWRQVRALLAKHASCARLIAQYEGLSA